MAGTLKIPGRKNKAGDYRNHCRRLPQCVCSRQNDGRKSAEAFCAKTERATSTETDGKDAAGQDGRRVRARHTAKIRTITLNVENYKTQKRQEKKAKIIEFKQKVREKSKKTLKYAAISIPLAGMGYLGFKGMQNAGPAFDFSKISMTTDTFTLPQEVLNKAATYYASVNEAFGLQAQDFSIAEPDLSWSAFMNPPEQPINEADYVVPVPLIQNDKLHNVPNIDFFNLCFSKSNETYGSGGKYGVSRELYAKFMRNQKATANFYHVGSYGSLSFDEARIIAKTEIFDKYGIAYIQNRSMGAYLYYALMKTRTKAVPLPQSPPR